MGTSRSGAPRAGLNLAASSSVSPPGVPRTWRLCHGKPRNRLDTELVLESIQSAGRNRADSDLVPNQWPRKAARHKYSESSYTCMEQSNGLTAHASVLTDPTRLASYAAIADSCCSM